MLTKQPSSSASVLTTEDDFEDKLRRQLGYKITLGANVIMDEDGGFSSDHLSKGTFETKMYQASVEA